MKDESTVLKDQRNYGKDLNRPEERLGTEWVAHDDLEPNEWNPNEMDPETREGLRQSILDNGWTQPIVVTENEGERIIVDGEQRWTVAGHELVQEDDNLTPDGIPAGHVPVHEVDIDELRARISTIQHNRPRSFLNANEFEDILRFFADEDALDRDVIERMNISERRTERMVRDVTASEYIGGRRKEMNSPWKPVPRHELDADELNDSRSEAVAEASRRAEDESLTEEEREEAKQMAEGASRVGWVLRPEEYERLEGVCDTENMAASVMEMVHYIEQHGLEEEALPDWLYAQLQNEQADDEDD